MPFLWGREVIIGSGGQVNVGCCRGGEPVQDRGGEPVPVQKKTYPIPLSGPIKDDFFKDP